MIERMTRWRNIHYLQHRWKHKKRHDGIVEKWSSHHFRRKNYLMIVPQQYLTNHWWQKVMIDNFFKLLVLFPSLLKNDGAHKHAIWNEVYCDLTNIAFVHDMKSEKWSDMMFVRALTLDKSLAIFPCLINHKLQVYFVIF